MIAHPNVRRSAVAGILALLVVLAGVLWPAPASAVVPKGDRILGMDSNEAEDGNRDAALAAAIAQGSQSDNHFAAWNDLEPSPNVYNMSVMTAANSYYPPRNHMVQLVLKPIDGCNKITPSDLSSLPFDNPTVITRFNTLLDQVFTAIPNLSLVHLSIGNEVGCYLANDPTKYAQYKTFFDQTAAHARTLRAGLKVGVVVTWGDLTGSASSKIQTLNTTSDVVMFTYYPVSFPQWWVRDPSVVSSEITSAVNRYPGRIIHITEVGYPSSSQNKSNQEKQRKFIENVFTTWDTYASVIKFVNYDWQHDLTPAALDWICQLLHCSGGMRAFIGSIGLRNCCPGSGTDKTAWVQYGIEAHARGW